MENKILSYLELLLENKKEILIEGLTPNRCLTSEVELLEEILHEIKNNI